MTDLDDFLIKEIYKEILAKIEDHPRFNTIRSYDNNPAQPPSMMWRHSSVILGYLSLQCKKSSGKKVAKIGCTITKIEKSIRFDITVIGRGCGSKDFHIGDPEFIGRIIEWLIVEGSKPGKNKRKKNSRKTKT